MQVQSAFPLAAALAALCTACDAPPPLADTTDERTQGPLDSPDDADDVGESSSGGGSETGDALDPAPSSDEVVGLVAFGGFDGPAQTLEFTADALPDSFLDPGTDQFTAGPAPVAAGFYIPEPAGYGHYCSMVWPGGGWAFASDTTGGHPCQYLRDQFGSGQVRRAGLFDASGTNQAVTWCDGQTWGPAIYRGQGTGPLTSAFDAAANSSEPGCVITVSPMALPIFDSNPGVFSSAGTGVDFARSDAPSMDTGLFGATGANDNPAATMVNLRGHAKSGIDNHDGWDWGAAENTPLRTMANGYVLRSRDYQTSAVACPSAAAATVAARQVSDCINRDYATYWPAPCTGWGDSSSACQAAFTAGNYINYQNSGWDGGLQGEVYVRHSIQTQPWEYRESFVVGYFHVNRQQTPAQWSPVGPGTLIADVGNGGWTSAPHLHMTVIRETNVGSTAAKDRWFSPNADSCTTCSGGSHQFHQYAVEPYGWLAPLNIDPRGWMSMDGAMSPNLWTPNFYHLFFGLPPTGSWGL